MAIVYIDPTYGSNGAGTFADPKNTWAGLTWTAGNEYLQKAGTTSVGRVSVGASGTAGNEIVLGTYHPVTGARITDGSMRAVIDSNNSADGCIYISGRSYIVVDSLELTNTNQFPGPGVYALNSPEVTVRNCYIHDTYYGIRYDNTGGTGITGAYAYDNDVYKTIDVGILVICGSTTNGTYSMSRIDGNDISLIGAIDGSSSGRHGVWVTSRNSTTQVTTSPQDIEITNNRTTKTDAYGILVNCGIDVVIDGNTVREAGYTGDVDSHCLSIQSCHDAIITNNLIEDCSGLLNGSSGSGVGIYIDTNTSAVQGLNVTCARNIIRRCGVSNTATFPGSGIMVLRNDTVSIYGNVIDRCVHGISCLGVSSGAKTKNISVFNNTIVDCNSVGMSALILAENVNFANNIVKGGNYGVFLQTGAQAVINSSESHNIVYGQSVAPAATGTHSSFSAGTLSSGSFSFDVAVGTDYAPRNIKAFSGGQSLGGTDLNGQSFPGSPSFGAIQSRQSGISSVFKSTDAIGNAEDFHGNKHSR